MEKQYLTAVPGLQGNSLIYTNAYFQQLKEKILRETGLSESQHKVLFLEGSTSYAIELVMRAALNRGKWLLLLNFNSGSERLERIADYLNIPCTIVTGEPYDESMMVKIVDLVRQTSGIGAIALACEERKSTLWLMERLQEVRGIRKLPVILDCSALKELKVSGIRDIPNYLIFTLTPPMRTGNLFACVVSDSVRLHRMAKRSKRLSHGPF